MEIEFREDHLYIRHGEGFEITTESMNELWPFLSEQCEKFGCSRVLAEGPAPRRDLDTVDAFQSGVRAAETVPSLWLAICFQGYEPDELSELFQHSARNRGVHVKFFSNTEQALKWLRASYT